MLRRIRNLLHKLRERRREDLNSPESLNARPLGRGIQVPIPNSRHKSSSGIILDARPLDLLLVRSQDSPEPLGRPWLFVELDARSRLIQRFRVGFPSDQEG
jgi:hypothetical protein